MPLAVLVLNVNQGMYFLIGEFCFPMQAKIVIDDKALCFMFLLLRHAHASYHILSYDHENHISPVI